jgi:hypothetical protein
VAASRQSLCGLINSEKGHIFPIVGVIVNALCEKISFNTLWGTKLSKQQLAEIGLALGADVPIFIAGHSAWAEGECVNASKISPSNSVATSRQSLCGLINSEKGHIFPIVGDNQKN